MIQIFVYSSILVSLIICVTCEIYQDRPKIKTSDGDLILEPAYGKNIYLRPNGPKSSVFVGDINVLFPKSKDGTVKNVPSPENYNQHDNELSAGADSILQRLDAIENKISTLKDDLQLNISALWGKVNMLNRKVRVLQFQVHRATDECQSHPCEHGGTCLNSVNGYQCLCPSNWEGKDCDIDVNECRNFASTELGCQNGAACINKPGSYECVCKPGWYGLHCTRKTRDCSQGDFEMCGHGTCLSDPTRTGITCICNQGWTTNGTSDECLTDVNECESYQGARCSVNPKVECINLPGSFRCGQCPAGYQGDGYTCSDIDECTTLPNGGCSSLVACHNTVGSFICDPCPPGYVGDGFTCTWRGTCNIDHGGCHPSARCIDNLSLGQTAQCVCPDGMDGDGIGIQGCYISSSEQSCSRNPCGTYGQCHELRNGYTCICQRGYGGPNCTSINNICSDNPCHNGGICRLDDNTRGYRCECTAQYTGPLCEMLSKTCGGVLDNEEGSIIYPLSNTTYNHDSRCAWVIHTVPSKVINVTFSKFDVEYTPSCSYDFLQIHDGRSSASQLIGRFCGNEFPNGGNIISSHNNLYFWFRSDSTVAKDGFTLHWTSIDPVCGGHIDATTHGTISSPGSPGTYPPNRDCYWGLRTDYEKKLQLHFFTLDIENHPNCSFDFLAIYDGLRTTDPLLNKFCNSSQPAPLESAGSEILIHFHSDAYGTGKGFQLAYAPIPGVPGCGGYYTAERGEITSPAFNGSYLNNLLCEYKIKTSPDTKIRLDFKMFNLERSLRCRFDYLKIYDGPSAESPLVGKFCGTSYPKYYVSSSNTIFVKFRSDINLSGEGFKIHYQALCIQSLHGDSGVIKSPGYPFNYPEDRICEYIISTVPGKAIQLTFQDFDIEENNYYNCKFDSVEIRDGLDSNSTLLGRYCGGSDHIPPVQLSTHNYMYIRFKSDMSLTGSGFYANYTTVDTECGGIHREMTGLINHPSDGTSYKNRQTCTWILIAPEGKHIQLTWNRFDLENMPSCDGDYLKLIEMDDKNGNNDIGKFCGTRAPPALTTMTNRLMMIFESDINVQSSGFSVSYSFLDYKSHCNGVYFKTHGFIYSPGWPKNYEPNWDCSWVIQVPTGQQIRLNISQFDLERPIANKCTHGDFLEVRNGATQSAPLIGQFCGKFKTKIIKSFSDTLFVRFHSDYYLTGKGFQIEWDGSAIGCGGTLTSSSGTISSPNYPQNYHENTVCFYRIVTSPGSRVRISFTDLDLERTTNCRDDYVEIFDGRDSGSTSLGSYCTMSAGLDSIITSTNYAYIKFRSDFYLTGKGFLLNYFTVCNNNITGRHGVIESPDFPNYYPQQLNCLWNINVLKGNKINVTFTSFDIYKASYYYHNWPSYRSRELSENSVRPCSHDYLQWKDSSESHYSEKLCGNSLPPMIRTKSNSLQIKFSTGNHPRSGFRLEWVNIGCGGYIKKRAGSIEGYTHSPEELECEWVIETPLGTAVYLDISEVYVTNTPNCTKDSVEIYNGQNVNSPLLSKICRNQRSVIQTTSNYAVVKFSRLSSLNGAYFKSTFTAVKATCGGNIELTAGYIYSKNYPHNYDNNIDCIWAISVPRNHRIEFNFLDLDLYSLPYYSDDTENCGDSIKIYENRYLKTNLNYTSRICPGSNITRYITKSNIAMIQFTSDSEGNAKGFKANFSMTCGASITAIRDGIISNRDYVGKSCTWTITAPREDQKIYLTITHIFFPIVGYNTIGVNCWPSYLRIYDGDDDHAPVIDEYCGKKAPPMLVSRGSSMTIMVGSYDNGSISGQFSAHYSSLNEACGGMLNSEEGTIASPNYPRAYPVGANCEWVLTTSPGNRVYITFEEFELEFSERCNEDYLEIREDSASGKLLGVFCGTDIPLNTTSASMLYIKFHSNEQNNGKGFVIHYGFLHGNELIDMTEGEIASPLYPHLYRGSATYTWRIQSSDSDKIVISIDNLEMPCVGSVCYNTLAIFDGYDDTAPLLSELYGMITDRETVLETSSNTAYIKLVLDSSNTGALFHLNWHEKHVVTDDDDVDIINCGANLTLLDYGSFSTFMSPNYPKDYDNNLNCEWIFQAVKGRHLKLSFQNDFKLEETMGCFADFINIYTSDNLEQWRTLNESLCVLAPESRDLTGSTYMKVKFKSDSSITRKGFKGIVSSVCGGTLTDLSGEVEPYWQEFQGMFLSFSCDWVIKVRPGRIISLKFTHFNISTTNNDCYRSVILRNGETSESPLLGKYCGYSNEKRDKISTTNNALHISFTFQLGYRNPFQNFRIHYEEKNIECGGTSNLDIDQSSEIINSPNYPDLPTAFSECIWKFTAPPGEFIRVDFIDRFDLDDVDDCGTEVVEIRDGSSNIAPLIGEYCSERPGTVKSSNNMIYIRYSTQLSVPRNGFKANVSIGYCGGTLVAESGEIKSPGYPHDISAIPSGSFGPTPVCEWRIKGPSSHVFKINPQDFDLPDSENSCDTKVTIEESIPANNSVVILKEFCNDMSADEKTSIETLTNEFVVSLYIGKPSEWSLATEHKGFRFTFSSSRPTCGGEIKTTEGYIATPAYPLDTSLKYCEWRIKVPDKTRRIKLELIDIDINKHSIGIYNDDTFQSLLQKIPSRDYSPTKRIYESTGSSMSVFLWLNAVSSTHRFKAKFSSDEEALCGGDISDKNGTLSSPILQGAYSCLWHYNSGDITYNSVLVTVTTNSSVTRVSSHCRLSDPKMNIKAVMPRFGFGFYRTICGTTEQTYRIPSSVLDIKASQPKNTNFTFNLSWKSQPCGGIVNVNENPVNILEVANVTNSVDCAWFISMPYNNRLELKMEGSFHHNCDDEFLKIGHGTTRNFPIVGEYCKSNTLNEPLLLGFMHVYVEYHSVLGNDTSLKLMAKTVKAQCGGQLTKYHRVFMTPNYPKNYEPNQECSWIINSEVGSRVSLKFIDRFVIEDTTNCTKDVVIIYDWKNETFDEMARLCGRTIPISYNSTFNIMKVIFRTDATTNLDGFKAVWSPICGGKYLATEKDQFLYSQGFPLSYLPRTDCTYTISSPNNKKLLVEFIEFDLEGTYPDCSFDNLTITADLDYNELYEVFCGQKIPAIVNNYNKITLKFKTDKYIERKGFKLKYKIFTCGGQINKPTVLFSHYGETYSNEMNCTWFVQAPENKVVVLKFLYIDLESHYDCYNDYVAVFDGLQITEDKRLALLCGYVNSTTVLRSYRNKVLLQFVSDSSYNFKGFKVDVLFTYSESAGCGGLINLTSSSSIMSLKSFRLNNNVVYENNLYCHWKIMSPIDTIIKINFDSFHISPCQGVNQTEIGLSKCDCDFVEIRDGINPESFVIDRYCGHTIPPSLVSSSNVMSVIMSTDNELVSSGFEAHLSVQQSECGKSRFTLGNTITTIKSPGFSTGVIPRGLHCVYHIDSDNTYDKVRLSIRELDLRAPEVVGTVKKCIYDKLIIFNRPDFTNRSLGKDYIMNRESDSFIASNLLITEDHVLPQTLEYCGSGKHSDIYLTGSISLTLITSAETDSNIHKGFDIELSSYGTCDANYTGTQGKIEYEQSDYLQGNADCYKLIIAPENHTISAYFITIMPDYWNEEVYLDIFDGNSTSSKKLVSIKTDFETTIPFFSTGRYMLLHSHSDASDVVRYEMNYITTDKGPGCGGKLSNVLGRVTSPLYPKRYRMKSSCEWELQTPMGTRLILHFEEFDLGTICEQNYVELIDSNGALISTFCSEKPADYTSIDNFIKIVFHTTMNNGGTGWVADFAATV